MVKSARDLVAEANAQIETVSVQEAATDLSGETAVFLDVREPTEWETHIEGALQIPRGILEAAADPSSPRHEPVLDPERRVIVYCRSGARSAMATATLKIMGFSHAVNLGGGFTAWREAGLPVAEHHAGI